MAASVEHSSFLRCHSFRTVLDAGANKGQFALATRAHLPNAKIIAFEPLPEAARVFRAVFAGDKDASLLPVALGLKPAEMDMHISKRNDSSSVLPIGKLQDKVFPGTEEIGLQRIKVVRLDDTIEREQIVTPALLKIDVQGYELELLKGAEKTLTILDSIYVELSFLPLYDGQPMAHEVVAWLAEKAFVLRGVYHIAFDEYGEAVQADFHFGRNAPA